ncbi:MAG: family N-acetyltransferase [Rhodoglobus sp.]|nr:family N-acetyltransferase [Rhodoglobus sp.]
MFGFEIREVTIPSAIDAPDAADFVRAIEVGNAVEELGYGTPELAYEPVEELPPFFNPHEPKHMFVAVVDGEVVARALYETQAGEEADSAWVIAQVLPEFRGRGIGSALADRVEALAVHEGKRKSLVYTPIAEGAGERIGSPTGFGSIPAGSGDVRFLQRRGYSFEQVERVSRLPLPVSGLNELVATAEATSGADYRVHLWGGVTPQRWREDLAVLGTRMSTDAPTAGLEEPQDVWTVERLIEADERNERMNPRRRLTAAVEHVPSGTLAGFTVLSVPPQKHRAVDQYATLVLREHRGHRLGMLMKVANLQHLARVAPGHPAVITFNAEENRHMLDVNEAVGFVPIANESAWRKDLA